MIDKILKRFGIPSIPDEYKKNIFLGFYFFFFLIILFLILFNKDDCNCKVCDVEKENVNNYSFDLDATYNDSENILFTGKLYNNTILLNKKIDDITTKYYIYYGELYSLDTNDKWILSEEKIYPNFDIKYLYIGYVESLVKDASYDKTEDKKVFYNNWIIDAKIEYSYDETNNVKYYTVKNKDYILNIKYYDFNNIKEFNESIYEL